MPVMLNGRVHGCTLALEEMAAGISYAGREIAKTLERGGLVPKTYTIQGKEFAVVGISAKADGSTDQQAALSQAMSAARSTPTLLILPPADLSYRYSNVLNISANSYLCGYGATVEPLGLTRYAHVFNGNDAGIFGLRMLGHPGTWSKWPERYDDNPTVEPNKNGNMSNNNGGGVTNDAWVVTSGRANIIVKDNWAIGSLTGFVRAWGNGTNHLYEGNKVRRSTSNSIHLTNSSSYMTARGNAIFDSGDDCISVVSYSKVDNPTPPTGFLIEKNTIKGGRGRGLACIGGQYVLHQDNEIADTNLAGLIYAATSSHTTHNVVKAVARRNVIIRCGRRESNHTNNSVGIAAFSYTGATVEFNAENNRAYTYKEWYAAGGGGNVSTPTFVRKNDNGGVVSVSEKNNTISAINSAD